MRLEEKFINYVRDAVDSTVVNTGYPCLGKHLEKAGIADRSNLRLLARRGHLKSVVIQHNNGKLGRGTQYTAYYTERLVPEWVTIQMNRLTEA